MPDLVASSSLLYQQDKYKPRPWMKACEAPTKNLNAMTDAYVCDPAKPVQNAPKRTTLVANTRGALMCGRRKQTFPGNMKTIYPT
jgi:hypothetical protein